MRSMISSSRVGLTPAAGSSSRMIADRPSGRAPAPAACAGRPTARAPARPRARQRDEIEQRARLLDRGALLGADAAAAAANSSRSARPPGAAPPVSTFSSTVISANGPRDLEGAAEAAGDALLQRSPCATHEFRGRRSDDRAAGRGTLLREQVAIGPRGRCVAPPSFRVAGPHREVSRPRGDCSSSSSGAARSSASGRRAHAVRATLRQPLVHDVERQPLSVQLSRDGADSRR